MDALPVANDAPLEREEPAAAVEIGTVKWFNNAKGWGFISRQDGSDVFVHYSQIDGDGYRTLRQGQEVKYVLRTGPRGQYAETVTW
ncbi:MAG: cold shock domain-containing protein [Myxococcota bacterium]